MDFESGKIEEESAYIQTPIVDDQVWDSLPRIIGRLITQIAPKISSVII